MTSRGRRLKNNIITEEWVDHFDKQLNPENANTNQGDIVPTDAELKIPLDDIEYFIFATDINEDEIRLAVKRFRKGKMPGSDCILPEFFIDGIDNKLKYTC